MEQEQNKQRQIVKSIKLVNHLLSKGFRLDEVRRNKNNLKAVVFFFENSPSLQQEMQEYMSKNQDSRQD